MRNFLKKLFPKKASEPDKVLTPSSRVASVTLTNFCYWCKLSPSLWVWDYHDTHRSCIRCHAPHPEFFHKITDPLLRAEAEEKHAAALRIQAEAL